MGYVCYINVLKQTVRTRTDTNFSRSLPLNSVQGESERPEPTLTRCHMHVTRVLQMGNICLNRVTKCLSVPCIKLEKALLGKLRKMRTQRLHKRYLKYVTSG